MKTTRFLCGAAIVCSAALLALSCSKENTDKTDCSGDSSGERYVTLDISIQANRGIPGRAALDENHSMLWEAGDSIGLFAPGVYAAYSKTLSSGKLSYQRKELINFALSTDDQAASGQFQVPQGHASGTFAYDCLQWKIADGDPDTRTFYAYYPHSDVSPIANYTNWDKKLAFSLPSTQIQEDKDHSGHLAELDKMWAETTLTIPEGAANRDEITGTLHFDFTHLFSLLEYRIANATGEDLRIDRVILNAEGANLAGGYDILTESGTLSWSAPVSCVTTECRNGFTLAAGESTTVYMVVAPSTLSGATVRIETDRGGQEFETNATLVAGHYYTKDIAVDAPQQSYTLVTVDFEDIVSSGQSGFLADSPFGDNLDGKNKNYTPYTHAASGLVFSLNKGAYQPDSYDYHRIGGGFWGSAYNDMTTEGIDNHSSVYYADPLTGKGGYDGSEYFAVCFESASSGMSLSNAQIAFADADREKVFDHLWINNTTFAVLDMEGADGALNDPFTLARKSWCRLTITGIRADGTESGSVEFYLADFRTADAPGIVKDWTKISLLPLGAVHGLRFKMDSSDMDDFLTENNPALNNPAYFCIDNVTIRQ